MAEGEGRHRWLVLIYRVPQVPPGRRTYVWRRLKGLGAVYLQQAAAILPDQPQIRQALETLSERILEGEGEVSLLETASPSSAWEQDVIARFNSLRNAEYAELGKAVERIEDDIGRETRKGTFTFAALEDVESDWEKLQRWQERIAARDFFATPGQTEAREALERAKTALAAFTAAVESVEG